MYATRADASALAGRAYPSAAGGFRWPVSCDRRRSCRHQLSIMQHGHAGGGAAPMLHLDRMVASLQCDGDRWSCCATPPVRKSPPRRWSFWPMPATPLGWWISAAIHCGRVRGQQSYLPVATVGSAARRRRRRWLCAASGLDGVAIRRRDVRSGQRRLPCPDAASHARQPGPCRTHAARVPPLGVDAATLRGRRRFPLRGHRPPADGRCDRRRCLVSRADHAALTGAHLADVPRRPWPLRCVCVRFARSVVVGCWRRRLLASEPWWTPHRSRLRWLDAIDPGRFVVQGAATRYAVVRAFEARYHTKGRAPLTMPASIANSAQAEYARHRRRC